jgi:hypothetical protein
MNVSLLLLQRRHGLLEFRSELHLNFNKLYFSLDYDIKGGICMPGYIPGPGREKVLRALFKPTIDIHPRNHLAVPRNTPQKDMQNPTS